MGGFQILKTNLSKEFQNPIKLKYAAPQKPDKIFT